ncbi:MAG: hypothetical protein HC792_02835 [Acaryochloridaceae cyanobacterium CSU_5_19]|nr:hypothetical protein [Acaryochloridaceae cyanobacterium CSU_5_19]
MQWINTLSVRPSLEAAIAEVVTAVQQTLTQPPDLGVLFVSSAYASEYPRVVPLLLERLPLKGLIGCGGGGVIGMKSGEQVVEVEGGVAVSLSVACLPEVEFQVFHLEAEVLPDLDSPPGAWTQLLGIEPDKNPQFILLSDPFSARITDLLAGLDFAYPGAVKIGGLASSSTMGLQSGLFCYSPEQPAPALYREGTVGVAISGKIIVETIVAQGCRPIGQPYRVAEAERNVVLQVEEQSVPAEMVARGARHAALQTPLEALQELVHTMDADERELAQYSLSVGIVRNEFKQDLEPGDFLIRNLIGVDPRIGAIAIGDRIRPGQRIQFHIRDAQASADDLEQLFQQYWHKHSKGDGQPIAALLFDCLGRGERFYGEPDFDSHLFSQYFQEIPVSGFFCNGEIGPIGGATFLHGYTAAFGIFRSQAPSIVPETL